MDHIIHQNLWDTCGIRPKNILIPDQIHQIYMYQFGGCIGPILGGKLYHARKTPASEIFEFSRRPFTQCPTQTHRTFSDERSLAALCCCARF